MKTKRLYLKPILRKDPKHKGLTQELSMLIFTQINKLRIEQGDPHGDISELVVTCCHAAGD
jgi:hypothetical protein